MAVAISQDAAALMTTTDSRAPWRERLTSWAQALRQSIGGHRDGGRVFAGTFAPDPSTFHITEAALEAWQAAGLSLAEAARRTVLIRHFVVGFRIEEQELAEMSGRRDTSPDEFKSGADPARFPLTSKALPTILTTSADERFRLGLKLMLSGI